MRRLTDRGRGAIALVVACLVHLGVQGALWQSRAPRGPVATSPLVEAPPSEVDLDVDSVQSSLPSTPPTEGVAKVATVTARSRGGEGAATLEPTAAAGDEAPNAGAEAASEVLVAPPSGSGWTFNPMMPNIHPRTADLMAANGGPAAAEVPPTVSTTGGLVEALDAADVERGLGRGGPVRTAIDLAARAGDGPVRGNATFSVTIFSDGRIDVQVASNHTDWSRIIPAIRDAVSKAQVRLPPNSRGLNVVVAVEAKVQYPDGYTPPTGGTEVTTDLALDVNKPIVDVGVRGQRCSSRLVIAAGGLGGTADCAVGNPMRVVATRVVSEQRL